MLCLFPLCFSMSNDCLLQERDGSFNVIATVSHASEEERESHTIHRDSSASKLPAKGQSPNPKGAFLKERLYVRNCASRFLISSLCCKVNP